MKKYIMDSFMLSHIFIIWGALYFFLWISVNFLVSLPEGPSSFSISYKTDLLATKFTQSLCIGECLYFPFIFEE